MVECTFSHVVIKESATGTLGDIIVRKPADVWLTPSEQVYVNTPIKWAQSRAHGEFTINMHPYYTPPLLELSNGFVFQLAFAVARSLDVPIARLHMSIGGPVDEVVHNGNKVWRCYLGFAVLLKPEDNRGAPRQVS